MLTTLLIVITWSPTALWSGSATPTIQGESTAFFGTTNGLAVTAWPKFQRDVANSGRGK